MQKDKKDLLKEVYVIYSINTGYLRDLRSAGVNTENLELALMFYMAEIEKSIKRAMYGGA